MAETDDPLWPHFKPLWLEFEKAGKGVLVAGGYGLYLIPCSESEETNDGMIL